MSRKLLYSNGSPFARKIRIVLLEMRLDFTADVDDRVRSIEDIQPYNPALQVPVFYDGDVHLFGSNLILEYLVDVYRDLPAVPADPPLAPTLTRLGRHWDDRAMLVAIEAVGESLVSLRLMQGATAEQVPYLARQAARIESCLDWLEPKVTPEGFWPGVFSYMDINLMCPLLYGEKRGVFDFRTGQWPGIAAMVDHWRDRPSVAATPVNEWPPVEMAGN
jgi:glutathione S-transferase